MPIQVRTSDQPDRGHLARNDEAIGQVGKLALARTRLVEMLRLLRK